jgi:chromosome segregation ATPase
MFVSRRKYTDLQARHERAVEQLAAAREDLAAYSGSLRRVAGRNTELSNRLADARDALGVDAKYAERLELRLYRALRACARYRTQLPNAQASPDVERSELWSLIDWSLWGAGMGDVFREQLADQFINAISPEQRQTALRLMQAWTDSGREPLGRRRYEDLQSRLHRALRACTRYRAELATAPARLHAQLVGDLRRSEKARGALDAHCRTLQSANEAMERDLRAVAEKGVTA